MAGFPKQVKVYVHGNDERAWEIADQLFLGGTKAHGLARHAMDEFCITLEYDETGMATPVEIDGRKILPRTK